MDIIRKISEQDEIKKMGELGRVTMIKRASGALVGGSRKKTKQVKKSARKHKRRTSIRIKSKKKKQTENEVLYLYFR